MALEYDRTKGLAKTFKENLDKHSINRSLQRKIHGIELFDGLSLKVGSRISVGKFSEDTIYCFDVFPETKKDQNGNEVQIVYIRALTEEYAKTGIESFDRLNALRFPADKVKKVWWN